MLLFAMFSAILISSLLLQSANGWGEITPDPHGYPYYDSCVRCEHTGTFNAPNDTFTATSITGWYHDDLPPAYDSGYWYFLRGYGGNGSYLFPTYGDMICGYMYGAYSFSYYDTGDNCTEGWGPWGDVHAWYQDDEMTCSSFNPSRQPSLQGGAQSYFYDGVNPNSRWYVSSWIAPQYMTAWSP